MSQPDDSNATTGYVLVDEYGKLVDSALWLELLTSGDIENHIFRLRKKDAMKTGREEQDIQMLSMKLLTENHSNSPDRAVTLGSAIISYLKHIRRQIHVAKG